MSLKLNSALAKVLDILHHKYKRLTIKHIQGQTRGGNMNTNRFRGLNYWRTHIMYGWLLYLLHTLPCRCIDETVDTF